MMYRVSPHGAVAYAVEIESIESAIDDINALVNDGEIVLIVDTENLSDVASLLDREVQILEPDE